MTLSDAITGIRYAIAEPTPGFWDDVELKGYINLGLHAMCESKGIEDVQRIVINSENRVGLPDGVKFVEGVYLYATSGTVTQETSAPNNPVDAQQYVNLTDMKLYTYSSTTATWTAATLPTRENLQTNNKVREIRDGYIEFTEAQTGLLEVFLYRFPDTLVGLTDEMELPEIYCSGVLAYAEAQAFLKDDNFPQYDRRMAEFARIRVAWEMERTHKNSQFTNRWI